VKLADVEPDGTAICVAWGCLRASHGADPSRPAPVVPGAVTRYEVELTPAFHSFEPGRRVRLVVASADYPWFARSMNTFGPIATQAEPRVATNTIHVGGRNPSALRLRVERPRAPDQAASSRAPAARSARRTGRGGRRPG
jgi:predicted acyl esterase